MDDKDLFSDRCFAMTSSAVYLLDELESAKTLYQKAQIAAYANPFVTKSSIWELDKALKKGEPYNNGVFSDPDYAELCEAGLYYYDLQREFLKSYRKLYRLFRDRTPNLPVLHNKDDLKELEAAKASIEKLKSESTGLTVDLFKSKQELKSRYQEISDLQKRNNDLSSKYQTFQTVFVFSVIPLVIVLFVLLFSGVNLASRTKTSLNDSAPLSQIEQPKSSDKSVVVPISNPASDEKTPPVTVLVYVTKSGSKYHTSSCSYLSNSKIAISLDDAVDQGYTPCSRCHPP